MSSVPYCVIKNCSGFGRLFKFPKSSEICTKWKSALFIDNINIYSRVCEKHFHPSMLGIKKLKLNAIPSLELETIKPLTKASKSRVCCISSCGRSGVRLYSFPKEEAIRNIWIKLCNVVPKNWLFLCGRHFAAESFNGSKLRKDVLPCLFLDEPEEANTSILSVDSVCTKCKDAGSRKVARLARRVASLQSKVKKLQSIIRKQNLLLKQAVIPDKNTGALACKFARLALKSRNHYDDEEKQIAQCLHFLSPKAYKYLREDLKLHLPAISSLHAWRPLKRVLPGEDPCLLANLAKLVKGFNKRERACSMILDEISISECLEYDAYTDVVNGYVDNGNERERQVAEKVMVVMLKGILSNWKFPLSYYCTGKVTRPYVHNLIRKCIDTAKELELVVKVVICDQGINDVYKELIADKNCQYMIYKDRKVFLVYDYCHLIKSIRNQFLVKDFQTPHGVASIEVLRILYKYDTKSANFRMCPKLSVGHLYPNLFEKMKVNKATQLFSRSVAVALKTCENQPIFDSCREKVRPTIKLVETLNDIFDELNCKLLEHRNYKSRPMLREDPTKRKRLEEYIEYVKGLKAIGSTRKVFCINGLADVLSCFSSLADELFEDHEDVRFFAFGKVNQDALENFFYQIRASSGIRTHPTIHDFQFIFARLVCLKLFACHFQDGNCEREESEALVCSIAESNEQRRTEVTDAPVDWSSLQVEEEENTDLANVKRYVAGYALHKTFFTRPNIDCDKCKELCCVYDTIGDDEEFLNFKDFTGKSLKNPSDGTFIITKFQMSLFAANLTNLIHIRNIKRHIFDAIKRETAIKYPEWYQECEEHKDCLLDFLIKVLLRKNVKWHLQNLCQQKSRHLKLKQKLQKL